jgi:MFS family permease
MGDWRARTRVFYGWWMVGALFLVLLNTAGAGFYTFPVFIQSLVAEFGWSVTQISSAAALWALVYGFSGPFVGVFIARFGAQRTMLAAAMLSSLALLGYASIRELWMLYACSLVSGVGVAGTTLIPSQTVITNWFNRYRGRAMSWMMLGIGAGGLLMPPLNEWLIRQVGWRQTWRIGVALIWLLVIPLIAGFVRTKPADLGLQPDGEAEIGSGRSRRSGLPVKEAVASLSFWTIFAVYVFQLVGLSALNFHFVPFAVQQAKFTSQQAAFFLGITVGFSMAGRLTFGWFADRWSPAVLMAVAGVFLTCGPLILVVFVIRLGLAQTSLLWPYAVLFGFGIAGNAIMLPVLVGRCFGELHFSRLQGLMMSGFAVGIVLGIPGAARIFDATGSYEWAFLMCIVAFALSSLLAITVQPSRYHAQFVSE